MESATAQSLVVIALAAVAAPVLAELLGRWRIPSVLLELALGMLIGPALLDLAQVDDFVEGLSVLGLSFLFFLAGYDLDVPAIRGAPLRLAATSWTVTVVLGLGVAAVLARDDVVLSSLLVGLALTTTALGTLVPMVRDRGLSGSAFGTTLAAAGAVGEFGPVLAVTLLLSSDNPGHEAMLLVVFAALAAGAAVLAARPRPPRWTEALHRHLTTSTQLPVRVVLLLVTVMVVIAADLGLDILLGAFSAGLIARLALHQHDEEPIVERLEAVGFGFLVPIFFIVTGMRFDVTALGDPDVLARTGLFLVLLLVVRGLPALVVYRKALPPRQRAALGVLQSTALPLIVVITEIGLATDRMRPHNATALVAAGMASVLVFPLVGFALLGTGAAATSPTVTRGSGGRRGG